MRVLARFAMWCSEETEACNQVDEYERVSADTYIHTYIAEEATTSVSDCSRCYVSASLRTRRSNQRQAY
eukprot:8024933-Heterocapsa_arctica.AAC.1